MLIQPYKSCECYHSPYARGQSKRYAKQAIHRLFRRVTRQAIALGEPEPLWISGDHVL